MGRNRINVDNNHYIVYGFDAPCGGYFAEYWNDLTDTCIDQIGFVQGVSKNRIVEFLENHKAIGLAKAQTRDAFNNLLLDLPC